MNIDYTKFQNYEELRRTLFGLAEEYPDLLSVVSIGKSHEGRDLWLAEVCAGDATLFPALGADGNLHSTELMGSVAALRLVQRLVEGYGHDGQVTRALNTRAFYILVRANPDGAERALAPSPRRIRSGTRPYPEHSPIARGWTEEDVDGDGRLLSMRIPDPCGPWKVSDHDPRLMVQREPAEVGGQYFRLLPEGRVVGFDGAIIEKRPSPEGLDFNRNFPEPWRRESDQPGAGPYPASEPEVAAFVDAVHARRNIGCALSFHTFSGVILRPFGHLPDEDMPVDDLEAYKTMSQKGTELSGYPTVHVHKEFRYHPKEVVTGSTDDWFYEGRGVFAWTIEVWSLRRAAGIELKTDWMRWFSKHPESDALKLIDFADEHMPQQGFVDWYPFEHPDLGPIEIGGWNELALWRTPPPSMRLAEADLFPDWAVWLALLLPELSVHSCSIIAVGPERWHIVFVLQNAGWLPTYVTEQAKEKMETRPIRASIEGADAIVVGESPVEAGHLEGRSKKGTTALPWAADPTTDRVKIEWVISAPPGTNVCVSAQQERSGRVSRLLRLGDSPSVKGLKPPT